jgi:RNA polymerase sigma factor (sigma-70 family)
LQSDSPLAEKEDAFTLIFNEHETNVYGRAKDIVGPFDAEDVLQDTFMKLWEKVDQFTSMNEQELGGLLRKIAVNASLNLQRKGNNAPSPEDLTPPAPMGDPVATLEFHDDMASLQEMTETQKQALMLRAVGYSPEDIAAHQDVTVSSAKSTLWRGRERAKGIRLLRLSMIPR